MWCPNCKNEYRPGITVCPDCKCDLIEELEKEDAYVEIARVLEVSFKDKIVKYLGHLNIEVKIEEIKPTDKEIQDMVDAATEAGQEIDSILNTDMTLYVIYVLKEDRKKAQKEIATIAHVEAERQLEEHPEIAEDAKKTPLPVPEKEFVKAKDRSADYKSSGWTFIVIGVLFTAFIVLNILGVIGYFTELFSQIVFIILGIACIIVGVLSIIKAKKIALDIGDEDKKETEMVQFLDTNISKSYLNQLTSRSEEPAELQWIQLQNYVKQVLLEKYPGTNADYADQLAEDFLNKLYEE